ncbi:MAG: hypothetical protein JO302_01250 [Candidatus Eremiobacteraeota bacterium]|nr:hypothetical protein [Candidatus Eremiobacteraeota bacterium]
MLDLAHAIVHVGFCAAIARLSPDATFVVRLRVADRIGRTQLARTYRLERGDGSEAIVEFDNPFGIYRLDIDAPKYACSATDYLVFIPGHTRSISETLSAQAVTPQMPMLLSGNAPQALLYANPTFVLFDKSAATCSKPIPAMLPTHITVENDQDAYYAWLYNDDATRSPGSQLLALRLQTPTHQHHYVRIPLPFPVLPAQWPQSVQLNISEDMIDELATEPVDTLLCPKMWRTSAG